ncbi:MAG: NUDIX hydrolase [Ruminococcus sp.]|nr:NUDIX hydrolase [Ruminococcus sp.]
MDITLNFTEKTLDSQTVYEGPIFTITHDIVQLRDGSRSTRDVLLHNGGVCVIPVTDNNEIYMVRQFRYPFRTVTLEVPAGKLEAGEDHSVCGRRELLEETGFVCSEFVYLGETYPTPAYNSEIVHMYLARGLEYKKQCLDEGEFLEVDKIPLSDAVKMVMNSEIKDSKTQLIILKAARILGI